MKILFLDHDGVMCLPLQHGSRFKKPNKYDADLFDKGAVQILNEIIIEIPDLEIVVSSDWRHHFSLGKMREMYWWQGVLKQPISFTIGLSGVATELELLRVKEINYWLNQHNIIDEKWCAVDDYDLSDLGENFVRTGIGGIKQNSAKEKIITILNKI